MTAARAIRIGGETPVARIGYGAMRLTGRGVWGPPPDRAAAVAVLRAAVDAGVGLVDTADSYGPAVSEEIVAEALGSGRADVLVATKGGYTRQGPFQWRPAGRPEQLRTACEGSLRRLGAEAIGLYYLHTPDPDVPLEESLGAIAELRAEGKVRHVGVSNLDADGLRRAQRVVPVAAVQNRFNLADRAQEDLLRVCEAEGIAFVPWFPLSNGLLTKARAGALLRVARDHGATPSQIALAWLLHRSPVTVPIPGTSSVAHLRENVAAARLDLGAEDMARLDGFRAPRRVPQPVRRAAKRVLAILPAR